MSSDEEGPALALFTRCDRPISKQLTLHTCIIDGPYGGIPAYTDLLQDGKAPVMLAGAELDLLLIEHTVVLEVLWKTMLQTRAQEGIIGQLQSDFSHKFVATEMLRTRLTRANQRAFAAEQDLSKVQTQYKNLLDNDCLAKVTEELADATTHIEELKQDLLRIRLRPLDLVSTAVQTSPDLVSAAVQTSPTTTAEIRGNPNSLPPTTTSTSYAQAVQQQRPLASLPPPIATPSHAVSPAIAGYKGSKATKANELHFHVRSRPAFNQRLARSFLEPSGHNQINHRHALADLFILAMYRVVNKRQAKLLPKLNRHIHNGAPPPAPIQAVFWSPKGNLIVRTKQAISDGLRTLLLSTVASLCGGDDGFEVLDRPALSLLKIKGVPTKDDRGDPLDPEQVLLELFDDPRIANASFWHTPRFVTYKGAPPGSLGTLFFSLVDSPDFPLGKSLLNTKVSLFGRSFLIQQWYSQRKLTLPPSRIYKEGLALTPQPVPSGSSAAPAPSLPAAFHEGGASVKLPLPVLSTDGSAVSTSTNSPALTDDSVVPADSYSPPPPRQELQDLFDKLKRRDAQRPGMPSLQDYLSRNRR